MGRKKLIEDSELIKYIERCFYEELNSNPKKLTASEISRYLKRNGMDIEARIIARNPVAMGHIESLKATHDYISPSIRSIVFKPLDAEEFVKSNTSKEKIKKALIERDLYYKNISDYAATAKNEKKWAEEKCRNTESKLVALMKKLETVEKKCNELKDENKVLKNNNMLLKRTLEDYVYPSIATELLKKEGYITEDVEPPVKIEKIEEKVISADTDIRSFLVRDMADEFDD